VRHKAIPPAYRLILESHGIFARVSKQMKVNPSFVSRVARRERRSKPVEAALREELQKILISVKLAAENEAEFWGRH
jgi:hypothetical protein